MYIHSFLTNQLVKEFWKLVHICQSYYQTSRGYFWDTVYIWIRQSYAQSTVAPYLRQKWRKT